MQQGDTIRYYSEKFSRYLLSHYKISVCDASDPKTLGKPLDIYQLLDLFWLMLLGCFIGVVMLISELVLRDVQRKFVQVRYYC